MKLEINPVEHCNLACRSCSHLSPIQPRHVVDVDELASTLVTLSNCYHARWLRLVGGEPLLHPSLDVLLGAIRASGIAEKIVLVTNGVLLPRLASSVWRYVDRIDVSQYPGKELTADSKDDCRDRARRYGVQLHFDRIGEFRVSYSEQGAASPLTTQRIFNACSIFHALRCHTVARGRFYGCPQSYFLARTIDGLDPNADSVGINENPHLEDELRALLARATPLNACRYCLGTAGKRFPHTQIPRSEFRESQNQPAEALLDYRHLRRVHVLAERIVITGRQQIGREAR